ncbi:MAG: hypothetical protein K9L68_14135 [Spirochaetales bacterium]|nr:hypothetical protein [Spirochaetales bacterium]MCF7939732.1 hypothetical protein [Spirochaetales bacterium]
MKGKVHIYDTQGNLVLAIQSIITLKQDGQQVTITYQDDDNKTVTIQTNMQYLYWQD